METQTHRIINRTQGSLLSEGVRALDATFQHLTVMRVLIEGLADNHEAGLWLTQVKGIPAVPRISPFDLIYVDKQQRVVEAVELLPAGEQPPFEEPSVSALVLPFQTISATKTRVGDQLVIDGAADAGEAAEAQPQSVVAVSVEPGPVAVTEETLSAKEARAVVEAALAAWKAEPSAEAKPVTEAKPAAKVDTATETVPSEHPRSSGHHARSGGFHKKHKNAPRTRKARRLEAIAEKNQEAADAERRRRTEAVLASSSTPLPHRAPEPVRRAAAQPLSMPPFVPMPFPQHAAGASNPVSAHVAATVLRVREASVELVRRGRNTNQSDTKSASERGNIMAAVNRLLHWLNPTAVDKEQRGSLRRPAKELIAYGGPEGEPQKHDVGDISSTGVYLRTEQRWEPGTKVALTLQRNGPAEHRGDKCVEVEAEAVRWGKDGVALEFAFPEAMRLDLWEAAAKGESSETGPDYVVLELRLARALGVFRDICPEVLEEVTRLFRKDFSSVRVAGGIRIALMAERLLRQRSEGAGLRAKPALVLHILETGSWADEEWIQAMWAGLLASSCTREGDDESNAGFTEILSHLAPAHLRLLEMACKKALTAVEQGAPSAICTIGELTKGLDLTNLAKTLRTVSDLGDHGLMSEIKRSPSDPLDTEARTSATRIGLKMYARCHGLRGDEAEFLQAERILPGAKA